MIKKTTAIVCAIVCSLICIINVYPKKAKADTLTQYNYICALNQRWDVLGGTQNNDTVIPTLESIETYNANGTISINVINNTYEINYTYQKTTGEIVTIPFLYNTYKQIITAVYYAFTTKEKCVKKNGSENAYLTIIVNAKAGSVAKWGISDRGNLIDLTGKFKPNVITQYNTGTILIIDKDITNTGQTIYILPTTDNKFFETKQDEIFYTYAPVGTNLYSEIAGVNYTENQIEKIKNEEYTRGVDYGYSEGYKKANEDKTTYGQTQYNKGYAEGAEKGNKYTFTALMLSIVDVPVQTLYGLLNFEILGYNMLNFVLGLISLAIVLYIIRKLMGAGGK